MKANIQLIKYIFFAGIATIIDAGLLFLLTSVVDLRYIMSSAISYCAGMIINYSLNKFLNFEDKNKQIAKQFSVFASVALVGLIFNQLIIFSLVELFDMWFMLAKIFSVLLVMFWSFWAHKKITFKVINS